MKLFSRGDEKPAIPFSGGERTATSFFYWASRAVPDNVKKLSQADDIPEWVSKVIHPPTFSVMDIANLVENKKTTRSSLEQRFQGPPPLDISLQ